MILIVLPKQSRETLFYFFSGTLKGERMAVDIGEKKSVVKRPAQKKPRRCLQTNSNDRAITVMRFA